MRTGFAMNRPLCLLLDDDAIAARFICDLLAERGYQVTHAASIAAANRLIVEQIYRFILVDRRLPDGDGVAWLRGFLAARSSPSTHCIVLTGDALCRADLPVEVDYLRKPIDATQLLTWLATKAIGAIADASASVRPELLENDNALRRIGGRLESLLSLRAMLRSELVAGQDWHAALADSGSRAQSLAHLHRLRAACALTGCIQLEQQAANLESVLRSGQQIDAILLADFLRCVSDTLAALAK